ncbi:MAG: hypothetical protein COZ86_02690 [Candidatus Moranbacteria bacterium CG_4_8_14_3_um_filter_41_13]|nr:MAG: hypothetical protein COZ86_02690 [Candidatus Moranbacteria bacterium CG_4_8_14_3_um_filter_41_13]
MKNKNILIGIALFLYTSFCIPFAGAETHNVIISEVQIAGDSVNDEFVELYNTGDTDQILTHWELRKKTKNDDSARGSLFHKFEGVLTIPAGGYFLWTNKESHAGFINLFDIQSKNKTSPNLANDNSLGLYDNTDTLIDSIVWGNGALFTPSTPPLPNPTKNKSLVRNITNLLWSLSDNPTPTNSHGETYVKPKKLPSPSPVIYDSTIRINEILANPSGNESTDEFIEFYNTSDERVNLSSWSIKDSSTSGKYIFPDNTTIQPKDFLVVYRKVFSFALNNSNETVSLLDPNGNVKDTVSYKTAFEDISYNYTASGWRGGIPTPGAVNQPNTPPEVKKHIPKDGYINVALSFDGEGSDENHDTLKYMWDFGDGHKSYKAKTTHTYKKEGAYIVTLKVTDGKDETITTSSITIESFPRKNVRIVAILPNPAGKDTGAERIIIRNNEKKKINLKDYSVATGWKKLVNHFIREDFFIKPKSEATLTHDNASFTLPNQKGKIELRAPGGKTLQKIHYKLDQPLAEDVWYIKEKGKRWEWKSPLKKLSTNIVLKKEITLPPVPTQAKEEKTSEKIINEKEENQERVTLMRSNNLSPLHQKLSLQTITVYGTNLYIPEDILLSLSSEAILMPTEDISDTSHTDSVLMRMNSTLNAFLNTL